MSMKLVLVLTLSAVSGLCHAAKRDATCDDLTRTAIDAALGEPMATYRLGVDFYAGHCVPQDYANAASLWETAAGFGIAHAKNNLGFLLSEGLGVAKDPVRAAQLWTEAARAGEDEAQVHLGHALFHGVGVQQDRVRGLAWVLRAINAAPDDEGADVRSKVLDMARAQKAEMLALQPDILDAAIALEPSVAADTASAIAR